MKKYTRSIISLLVVLALILCVVPAAFAAETSAWTSLTEHYTINEDGSVTGNGVCEGILNKTNFCLNNGYIARGDYSVTVKMQGTMGFPNSTQVQEGIIPWYQDANNYLFVYVQWADNDRTSQMHQLHISGKVNGEHLGYYDCWTDGVPVSNDTALTLTVTREVVDGCVKLSYVISNGEASLSNSRTFDAQYTEKLSEDGQMGVYAYGNGVKVTFSEFSSTAPVAAPPAGDGEEGGSEGGNEGGNEDGNEGGETVTTPTSNVWTSLTKHYNLDGSKVVSTGACENILTAETPNFVLHNNYISSGDFTVSVKLQGTTGLPNEKHIQAGIIPWYLDENNYLYVYVEWSPNERPTDIRCIQISGKLNGTHIGYQDVWCDGINAAANEELTLTVEKTTNADGTVKLAVRLNGSDGNVLKTGERTLNAEQSAAISAEGKMGVYAYGDTVTFTGFTSNGPAHEEENPGTGDTGIALAVACAIVSVMGAAVLVSGKKE